MYSNTVIKESIITFLKYDISVIINKMAKQSV